MKNAIWFVLVFLLCLEDVYAVTPMMDDSGHLTADGNAIVQGALTKQLDHNVQVAEKRVNAAALDYVQATGKAFSETREHLLGTQQDKVNKSENPIIQEAVRDLLGVLVEGEIDKEQFFVYVHKHCGSGRTHRDNERLSRLTNRLLANTRKLTRAKDVGYAWGVLTYAMNKTSCNENPVEAIRAVDKFVYGEYFTLQMQKN